MIILASVHYENGLEMKRSTHTSLSLAGNCAFTLYAIFSFLGLATNWASGEDDHVVARAEYDFSAASEEEISLRAGDLMNLAPKGEIADGYNRKHK